jgi:hypothetical protein
MALSLMGTQRNLGRGAGPLSHIPRWRDRAGALRELADGRWLLMRPRAGTRLERIL